MSLTTTGHNIRSFEDFVYIGLRKDKRTGKWYWTDGSKVNYTKWAVHQPDSPETKHCTQLHQDPGPGLIYVENWKWNSISCDTRMKYFVCKR
ncbi:lectin C-type domain protein [Ancylostoma caninum]|uniref:Lectin C-type domain protein n=1 Tax=Ancylostoma caninum TaxID=29170 RepID=A0A368H7F1_ANCCA|nr:lectin C-type domain protein [Ancylostoma caninum]